MIHREKLYILPFDHRGSFLKIFGLTEKDLTPEKTAMLADRKHIVYEGFLEALKTGAPKEAAAILVDEQFGSKIHKEAREIGITRILTVEKSGQNEFDFEYGSAFDEHIEKLKPDYAKVLVRYNPENDKELNNRQIAKLKIINNFCEEKNYGFLFELLVEPTEKQLGQCKNDKNIYENTLQGLLMIKAITELHKNEIRPDIWKIEGLENFEHMKMVVEETRMDKRKSVGVVVLGRGENEEKVKKWLITAAKIPYVVGFAVGRTVFSQALLDHYAEKIDRKTATKMIAKNYKNFIDLFENAKTQTFHT